MALQFYAVRGEALAYTHDALQAHAQAHGLRPPGPTRALRVAQLYGHLQLRAAGRPKLAIALSELATSWRLQPRQLRQDLALLQALGWLSATGTNRGTQITLHPPELTDSPRQVPPPITHLEASSSQAPFPHEGAAAHRPQPLEGPAIPPSIALGQWGSSGGRGLGMTVGAGLQTLQMLQVKSPSQASQALQPSQLIQGFMGTKGFQDSQSVQGFQGFQAQQAGQAAQVVQPLQGLEPFRACGVHPAPQPSRSHLPLIYPLQPIRPLQPFPQAPQARQTQGGDNLPLSTPPDPSEGLLGPGSVEGSFSRGSQPLKAALSGLTPPGDLSPTRAALAHAPAEGFPTPASAPPAATLQPTKAPPQPTACSAIPRASAPPLPSKAAFTAPASIGTSPAPTTPQPSTAPPPASACSATSRAAAIPQSAKAAPTAPAFIATPRASGPPEPSKCSLPAAASPATAQPLPTAPSTPQRAIPVTTATNAEPSARTKGNPASQELIHRLAALYNLHRPPSWPAYHPRGQGLRTKVRQALQQAGGADALADTLVAALGAMPSFWRHTYPVGRSGAECMAVLFATDRGCAGLGVEFWHLFTWAQAAADQAATPPPGLSVAPTTTEDPLTRARRLFLWDSGVWRGQGREALLLSPAEKRRLTLLLEAQGEGLAGTAERQFPDVDDAMADSTATPWLDHKQPLQQPQPTPDRGDQASPVARPACPGDHQPANQRPARPVGCAGVSTPPPPRSHRPEPSHRASLPQRRPSSPARSTTPRAGHSPAFVPAPNQSRRRSPQRAAHAPPVPTQARAG